jgi:WS/DGAT/MGAT family acyltransferase
MAVELLWKRIIMATGFYERLSSLDHSFLLFEGPTTYMHVAAAAVLDARPLTTAAGGVDMDRIRRYVDSRLKYVPTYRQRLHYMPIENHPVWVDDHDFDLGYHVRHSSLPKPGTEKQLRDLCGRLLERPLDRRKPLWEIWVIEGLSDNRFALFMKVHHCMVDGIAGVGLMSSLFSMTPDTEIEETQPWKPRPLPTNRELLRDELSRRARMSLGALRRLPSAFEEPGRATDAVRRRVGAFWEFLRTGVEGCAPTSVNKEIGPHRRVEWLTFNLEEVKEVKNRLGGTINDVVLATVTGAVRSFLERRGDEIAVGDFRVGVPVNMRSTPQASGTGNHIWAWIVPLPVHERSTQARIRILHEETERLKNSEQAQGGELVTSAVDWTTSNLLPFGVRLLTRMHPYNMLVTNVPGPPVPLYLLGARIEALYPYAPLFNEQGLGIALFSYAGTLSWGIVGDWDVVPDLAEFAEAIKRSFYRLKRTGAEAIRDRESRRSSGPPREARRQKTGSTTNRPRLAAGH